MIFGGKPTPPSAEQEIYTYRQALPECVRRIRILREEGDELAASLMEAELNIMLDKLVLLGGATNATEATET